MKPAAISAIPAVTTSFVPNFFIRRIETGERLPMTSAKGNVAAPACSVL
jgi:hypothetical protein